MRKTSKIVLSLLLALVMCLVLAAPAFAAEGNGLTKLANPTELKWDATRPGYCSWKADGYAQNEFLTKIYLVGADSPVLEGYHHFFADHNSSEFGMPSFAQECAGGNGAAWESGDYYFTVQSIGDGIEYSDSDVISSKNVDGGIYHYTKPDNALPTIGKGSWSWPAAEWTEPANKENIGLYLIDYGFSETRIDPNNGLPDAFFIGGSRGISPGNADMWLQEKLVSENGNGFYYFRVRALSSNIETIQNGSYSPWSDAYDLKSASQRIQNTLTGLNTSATAGNVKAEVQKLNQVELENAMRADLDGSNGTIDALMALEDKAGGPAGVTVSADMASSFASTDISVVGAKLNNTSGGDITLNVGRAQDSHDIRDELYNSTVAVDFSMTLDNAANPGNLDVPVKVTMPIPSTINPAFLTILHYHADGSYEEVHTHCFKNDAGKWFVSFVLTSFSDFVMTETVGSNLPTVEKIPAVGTAVARTQTVKLDGKDVQFQYYAVKDANGNESNYVKIRDLAQALNGTKAQFNVGWDGKISITSNTTYQAAGGEGSTPYSGNQPYTSVSDTPVSFNGSSVNLTSFSITYQGGGYTYYKLRDLGQLLGFNVKWDGTSVVIETDKPYTGK